MIDMLYVVGTIGFFTLMLGYVAGCERLGKSADEATTFGATRP